MWPRRILGSRFSALAVSIRERQVLALGGIPLFVTDGFKEYMSALLSHFGSWVQP